MKHIIKVLSFKLEKPLPTNYIRVRSGFVEIDGVTYSIKIKINLFSGASKRYYTVTLKKDDQKIKITTHPDWKEIRRQILIQANAMDESISLYYARIDKAI